MDILSDSCEIPLRRMPQNHLDDRQQAITWANVGPDPCRYMASQGH